MPVNFGGRKQVDVTEAVRDDHRRLQELIADLQASRGDGTLARVRKPRVLAQRLVIEASRHEAAEEQYLWPVVRDACEGGPRLVRAGLAQERRAKRLLHRLEAAVPGSEPFEVLVGQVAVETGGHIAYEERVLAELATVLSDEVADRVGRRFQTARALAPTRPHPHVPPVPGLLKLGAKTVGRLDRARDFVTRRGR